MFASIGIDNLEEALPVTRSEWIAIEKACLWRLKPLGSASLGHVLLADPNHDPLVLLRAIRSRLYADLNIPKMVYGHNVRLAGQKEVEAAISVLTQNTAKAAKRLCWRNARVTGAHLTFTCEVPDFEACIRSARIPRGFTAEPKFHPNLYHNSKSKDLHVAVYEKRSHLHDTDMEFPDSIELEMDSSPHFIFRFEVRLNDCVLSELKRNGHWSEHSLLAEDLFGPAFIGAMKYLEWRFRTHFPTPLDRSPGVRSGMSAREYGMLNTRLVANTYASQMRQRAFEDYRAGLIPQETYEHESRRIALIEDRNVNLLLTSTLQNLVNQLR